MEGLLELLQKAVDAIPGGDSSAIMLIALAVEMVLRMVKSDKPLSILYLVSAALKLVAEASAKVAALLDKVLPQKLKAKEEG